MKARWIAAMGIGLWFCWPALADTITLAGGGRIEGIITKLEAGKVYINVSGGQAGAREIELREITSVNFDTPHLTAESAKVPLEHFMKDLDAQEMVRMSRDMNQARQEARAELDKIKVNWAARQPVDKDQVARWNAAKESFRAPFARYRETVGEMYLHVLARIDDYNKLAREADQVYIGVKGLFNVGSGLVPADLGERTVKQSVPKSWYDQIYFNGYNRGYKEGADFERLNRVPQACEERR